MPVTGIGGRPDSLLPFQGRQRLFRPRQALDVEPAGGGLEDLLASPRAARIEVITKAEWDATPEIGRFARIHDPEGDPVELREPPAGA